jgi:hypothetical protein
MTFYTTTDYCYTIHNTKKKKKTCHQRGPILRLVSNTAALPNAVHQWRHAFYPCVGNAIRKHNEHKAQQDHNRQSSITLGLVCESAVGYGTYHAGSRPLQVKSPHVASPFLSIRGTPRDWGPTGWQACNGQGEWQTTYRAVRKLCHATFTAYYHTEVIVMK